MKVKKIVLFSVTPRKYACRVFVSRDKLGCDPYIMLNWIGGKAKRYHK